MINRNIPMLSKAFAIYTISCTWICLGKHKGKGTWNRLTLLNRARGPKYFCECKRIDNTHTCIVAYIGYASRQLKFCLYSYPIISQYPGRVVFPFSADFAHYEHMLALAQSCSNNNNFTWIWHSQGIFTHAPSLSHTPCAFAIHIKKK